MAKIYSVPIWKKAPFIRLLLPLVLGILLEWHLTIPISVAIIGGICFGIAYGLFLFFPLVLRYRLQALQAIIVNLLLVCLGLILTWQKDIRNSRDWMDNYYQAQNHLVLRIDEPLQQKQKSYKAYGYVESIVNNDNMQQLNNFFAVDNF